MLKVDNWHITFKCCTAAIILSWPHYSYADSYFCQADQVSGFSYDLEHKTWKASTFSIENRKYLISKADTTNIFIKALKYDYEIKRLDSPQPVIHCKDVKLTDTNEETGLVVCRGPFGASFNFDKRSGRYIRSQPTGYVSLKTGSKVEGEPYLEIGRCSPN